MMSSSDIAAVLAAIQPELCECFQSAAEAPVPLRLVLVLAPLATPSEGEELRAARANPVAVSLIEAEHETATEKLAKLRASNRT